MDGNNINNFENQQAQPAQPAPQPTYNSGVNYGAPVQPVPVMPVVPAPQGEEPYSIGKFLGCMLLSLIPCVNIIMLFVWAFADGNTSRKNWAKAQLIFVAIIVVLYILAIAIFGAALAASLSSISDMLY